MAGTMTGESVPVDVLICAHNEAENVSIVLDSLAAQTIPVEKFRVIFVDNASTDTTSRIAESYRDRLTIKCIYEPRLGLNVARNRGYEAATAEYVAHLDAETHADPRWLEQICRVIGEEDPDLCGGPYYPFHQITPPTWFREQYHMLQHGDVRRELGENEFLSGTNMVWRRSVTVRLGGFGSGVGLIGRGLVRGDETELIVRARRTMPGFRVIYDPAIVVYNLVRPEVYALRYWIHRSFANGRKRREIGHEGKPGAGRLESMFRGSIFVAKLLVRLTFGVTFRNRRRHPHAAGFLFETTLHLFKGIGESVEGVMRGPVRNQSRT